MAARPRGAASAPRTTPGTDPPPAGRPGVDDHLGQRDAATPAGARPPGARALLLAAEHGARAVLFRSWPKESRRAPTPSERADRSVYHAVPARPPRARGYPLRWPSEPMPRPRAGSSRARRRPTPAAPTPRPSASSAPGSTAGRLTTRASPPTSGTSTRPAGLPATGRDVRRGRHARRPPTPARPCRSGRSPGTRSRGSGERPRPPRRPAAVKLAA